MICIENIYVNTLNKMIQVIPKDTDEDTLLKEGVLSLEEVNMDRKIRESVSRAIEKARLSNVPIGAYDKDTKEVYLEYSDGRKENIAAVVG